MRALLATVFLAFALPGLFGARAPAHDAAPGQQDAAKAKACEKLRKEIMAEPGCADEARSAEQVHCEASYVQVFPLAKACEAKTGKSIIPRTKPLKGTPGASAPSGSTPPSRPPKAKTHSTYYETTPTPTP